MFKFLVLYIPLTVTALGNTLPGQPAEEYPLLSSHSGRIMNGIKTNVSRIPYQIRLEVTVPTNRSLMDACGGVIISKSWILTAAHCCTSPDKNDYTIIAGTTNVQKLSKGASIHSVSKIIVHGNFKRGEDHDDIALLQVRERFREDVNRKTIPLYNKPTEYIAGHHCTASGWGCHGDPNAKKEDRDILHRIHLRIMSKSECKKYRYIHDNGEICAAPDDGRKDVCGGDSGGPLVVDGKLVGIVAHGKECDIKKCFRPIGVYTEISYYRNWIKQNSGV